MLHAIRRLFSLNDPGWGRGRTPGGDGEDPRNRRPQPERSDSDGPPDLDELWRDFNRKLNGMFGRGGGGGQAPGGGGGPALGGAGKSLLMLLVALFGGGWLLSGVYTVDEGFAAAVMRFGEFRYLNDRAGIAWRLPYPFETQEKINVQQLRQIEIGYRSNVRNKVLKESLMLTQDQSIVDMQFAVQYRVSDPFAWLFNNNPGLAPEELIRQGAETAMREVVGRRGVDQVLYEEKEAVAKDSLKLMQSIVDRYKAGVAIVDVTIQQAQPPEQVQAAFEDANKAAQDRERLINEGRAYANDVIPKASGAAARLGQEAEGYRQRVVATAEGDASRFRQVLTEYSKAPQVTRDRLYLETMQQVFSNATKVYVDSRNGTNLLHLPLERLIQQSTVAADPGGAKAPVAATQQPAAATGASTGAERSDPPPPADAPARGRDGLRSRDRDSGR